MNHKLLLVFAICIASSDIVFGQGHDRRCSPCAAFGKEYPPNSRFQHVDGCSEFNCDCNCDGSFLCPPERTRDVCGRRDNCMDCNVRGQFYKSNSPFKFRDGCYEYNCFCKCDGGWNCPSEKTVDVCNTNTSTGCYYCDVHGRKIEGNSYFTHRNACIEYKSCICNCDGSWNCPGEYALDHCRQNVSTGCYFCNVDQMKVEGNSRFDLVRDCYLYSGCICKCDGGWTCAHTTGKYLCDTERGRARYSSTEVSSVQKITGSQESYQKSSEAWQLSSGSCLPCYENNREYAANTNVYRDVGCNRFSCMCRCDGTVYCDPSNIENICTGGSQTGLSSSSSASGRIESGSSSIRHSSSFESERASTGVGLRTRDKNTGSELDTCFQCSDPAGKKHNAGSYFEYEVGCFRFGCNCRCNGSYDCPATNTKYICRDTGERRCNQCKAGNKIYFDGETFSYTSGCYFYPTCKCECDGSWSCSEDDAKYTCDHCRSCSIGGKTYQGNSNFELERGCEYFPKCFCNCSGSWSCSGEGVRDICGNCRKCNVNGTYYDGNARFQYQDGCTLYRNCECNCDGSWRCRGGRYTCSRNDTAIISKNQPCHVLDRRYSEGENFEFQRDCMLYKKCTCERDGNWFCKESVDTCGNCRSCIVNGTSYAGGSKFPLRTGCYNYRDCSCNCDGTWNCMGETAVDLCNTCKRCRVEGQDMNPFTRFPYERNCWKYQCFCNCDGSTECPPETAINTCSKPDICRKCNVNNGQVEGNTHFSYILDTVTMNCRCNCDGSYFCFGDLYYIRTDISLSGSLTIGTDFGCVSCVLDARTYPGNSTFTIRRAGMNMECRCFCNGAYYCRGQTQVAAGCQSCLVYGTEILGDRPFDLVHNGLKLSCTCACGGSYVCLGLQKEVVISCDGTSGSGCLTSTCRICQVDSSLIDGGTVFRTSYLGSQLTCLCGCDGSYFCEGESGVVVTCVGGKCTELGPCTSCSVFSRQYSGDSEFSLVYRGLKLNCKCRCGGDYQCLGSTGEAIISCAGGVGCLQSSCGSCIVDGKSIPGRNSFMTVYNGTHMQCDCGCDGSYYCEGVSVDIKISCIGRSCTQLGCRQCNIYGTLFNGNSQFDIIHNGLRMNCRCACDASYQCFGTTGKLLVSCGNNGKGCLPSRCRPCLVNGGRYEGGTTFDYLYNGIEMKCQCGCDGNSFCTGVYEEIEISCIGGSCTPVECGGCNIFGRQYAGLSKFDIIYKGLQLNCQCSCNGDYVCVGSTGISVVSCKDGRGCLTDNCRSCIVDGQEYAGRSTFTTSYNGLDVSCTCGCDGTYFCTGVSEVISVSCIGGSCNPIRCGTCSIFGKNYPGASRFDIVYNGVVINCRCSCDGSYKCYGSTGGEIVSCIGGRGCLPQTCRPCLVNGREFMGGSQFQTIYNEIDMSCTCGCDGSYFCKGVSVDTRIICVDGLCRTEGCGTCSLFGRTFAGGSSFKIVYGGYEIQCTCECSGGYRCIGKTGTVIQCSNNVGCLLPPCNQCIVDGRSYPGQSEFSYVFNGIQMRCTCGCDGSYFCRGVTEVIEIACHGGRCTPVGCSTCSVDGRQIASNSEFETYYNNIRMACRCNCDGSYRCQGVEVSITIECRGGACLQIGCRSCIFQGREYQPKTQFEAINNNRQERCQCECDGSVKCSEVVRPQCNHCLIDGIRYVGHTRFRHQRGQLSLICTCYCNGTYDCNEDHRINEVCKYCVIDGERYKGNTRFEISKGDKRNECTCNCDGTYRCYTKNVTVICRGTECGELTCTPCTIDGRQYPRNNRFQALIQGSQMQCSCECDGSYRCEGERRICTSSSGCVDTCSSCYIAGARFDGNTQFEAMVEDIRMRCTCNCDGSYRCEGNARVCTLSGCVDTGCGRCEIEGRQYDGNTEFEAIVQGLRMKCRCSCDGSYTCTSEYRQCTVSGCINIGCRRCEIEGRQYDGNTEFEANVQGLRMKCRCSCDGSYTCTSEYRQCTVSGCIDVGCRRCEIEGRQYDGNTEFEANVQGLRMKCRCSCDGSYTCTSEYRQCTTSGCINTGCRRCTIDGREYQGNTQFKIIIDNIPVQCTCKCDGSYSCRGEKEYCVGPGCNEGSCAPCTIEGRNYSGNTRFEAMINGVRMQCTCLCGGSYTCQGEVTQTNCYGTGCREGGCNDCIIDGRRYRGNTRFETTYNGIPVQCTCLCDGSYSCKGERTTTSCEGAACTNATCGQCVIDGRPYAGNTRFEIMRNGIPMQCTCRCDGSYSCRGENTVTTCIGPGCETGGCGRCIADGHVYEGNSRFQMEIDGVEMNCMCSCDGSYKCTGLKEVTACTGPSCDSRCRDCNVMGRTYRGNTQFTMQSGGIQLVCVCRCDGGYSCTGQQTITTCDGGSCDQTCRSCIVDGREVRGNSRFETVRDGVPLKCMCRCDGGYSCQGEVAQCKGPGCQDGCRMCEIDGRPYTGNTRFRIQRGGRTLNCACYCDGSYECEGDTYTNACQGDGCADQACRNCFLDGVSYKGNSRFVLERAGFTMNCVCECDGAYRCQGNVAGMTCTGSECNNYGCRYCEIDGKQHPGNSQFTLEKGDITLSCECNCDGTYRCDGRTLAVACIGAQCGGGGCRTCEVDGKIYQGNTRFSINNDGLRMECVCNCDGSYSCRGHQVGIAGDQAPACVECEIDGRRYAGNTRFDTVINGIKSTCTCKCDGSYSCTGSTVVPGESVQCRQCSVLGRQYKYLDKFEISYNGQAIPCECLCDGGYECVKKGDGAVCTGNECVVRGCQDCAIFAVNYRGNTRFVTNAGGVTLECQCDCKGGYTCRGAYTRASECSRCVLGYGDVYEGNIEFKLTRGCFQIDCFCHCNGSWVCSTQRPRNVCGPQTLSRVPTPESTSLSHSSRYDIAGSHVKTDSSSRVSDTRLVSHSSQTTEIRTPGTGSCQSCTVNNKEYRGNTAFELLDKCLKFRCQCDCSGNWDCASVETITECISGDCMSCRVGSVSYKPNSQFEYRDGCNLYRCYCSCDGAYDCPAADTEDLCSRVETPSASRTIGSTSYTTEVKIRPSGSGSRVIEETQEKITSSKSRTTSKSQTSSMSRQISSGNSSSSSIQGRPSRIASSSNGNGQSETLSSGSRVHTSEGSVSSSHSGTYHSSGSFPDSRSSSEYSSSPYSSSRSGSISESGSSSSSSSSSASLLNALLASGGNCTNCQLGEMVVQGMKSFTFQTGCAEYLCNCNCDGSYSCPASRRSDICDRNGGISAKKTRECEVKDHVYFTRRFTYIEGCLKFYCQCYNNGAYNCPKSQIETVC